MSNHGMDAEDSPLRREFLDIQKEAMEKTGATEELMKQLGATGRFPQGKLTETDQGEIAFAVQADPDTGLIHIHFGKPVAWFSMTPELANDLCNSLIKKIKGMGKPVTLET